MVAAIRAIGSPPSPSWPDVTRDWVLPGRFTHFVFKVTIDHCAYDYFPGLALEPFYNQCDETGVVIDTGLFVGGSLDQWDAACYALLNNKSPHDCCVIYRQVYNTLTAEGYPMTGRKSSNHGKFYLL